jgi:glycosyltransferase involved in cell wall biosynthesis
MKVLLLSDPSNSHTVKWANSLVKKGVDVFLFGLSIYDPSPYHPSIKIESLNTPDSIKQKLNGNILKSIYLLKLPRLKKIINTFKPDVLHAHYASSYGLLGALSGFHPFIVSVWGIDVYIFPNVSFVHKLITKYVLNKAEIITSSSYTMADEAKKFTYNRFKVIPFGIDINTFKQAKVRSLFPEESIVIGIVKHLEYKYGLEYLVKAFSSLTKKYPDLPIKLLIVGGGSMKNQLQILAEDIGIKDKTIFTGAVKHSSIAEYHNMMDIEVYLSDYESFGVSVIEASACENPVVVSNVGGLPEVVDDNETGIVVEPKNPKSAAEAIEKLILDDRLRIKMGKAGRNKVEELYDWEDNVSTMIDLYSDMISKR